MLSTIPLAQFLSRDEKDLYLRDTSSFSRETGKGASPLRAPLSSAAC